MSTELRFSDELLQQINSISNSEAPEGTRAELIDFDAKGTVHLMRRDNDGKLLQDVPIVESHEQNKSEVSVYDELAEEYRKLQDKNERTHKKEGVLYIAICIILVICVVAAICMK